MWGHAGSARRGRGGADLAEALHGAPEVQQQVCGRAQQLVHRDVREGSPQPRLNLPVQECALTLVGRLQQGSEGGGWRTLGRKAAWRLKGLGEAAKARRRRKTNNHR